MPRAKPDDPWIDKTCACEPCSQPFRTQNPKQAYCCDKCRHRQGKLNRKNRHKDDIAEQKKHIQHYEFSKTMDLSLVADAEHNRIIRTAQAWGMPLKECEKRVACLKESGEYDEISGMIKRNTELKPTPTARYQMRLSNGMCPLTRHD